MRINILRRVVLISLIGNIVLTLIKLIFGYLGSSESLFSDGVNSFVDIFISLMLLMVIRVTAKEPDENHPYGHEKFEGILYLFLGLFITALASILGYSSIESLITVINNPSRLVQPEFFTVIASIISLLIKIGLFILNFKTAKKYQSVALYGDSKNHMFDIFSTSISLISITFALIGFVYFEPVASILIALFIFYSGLKMILEAISFLVDEAPDHEIIKSIKKSILVCQGVLKVDDLKVRKHMSQFYVDVEISVDNKLSLEAAHKIAEDVQIGRAHV